MMLRVCCSFFLPPATPLTRATISPLSLLPPPQVVYAAHDAWLSRELLLELHRTHTRTAAAAAAAASAGGAARQLPPPPPPPALDVLGLAAPFMDVFSGFKTKRLEAALGPARGSQQQQQHQQQQQQQLLLLPGPNVVGPTAAAVAAIAAASRGAGGSGAGRAAGGEEGSLDGSAASGGGGGSSVSSRRNKDNKAPIRKSVLYENCRLLVRLRAFNMCSREAESACAYIPIVRVSQRGARGNADAAEARSSSS